jgi:hypothetical protein
MKNILVLITAFTIPFADHAQTPVNRSIPLQPGQRITMHFDYPEMVRVSTWDKNEISIQGSVAINGGENDDAFDLQTTTTGSIITIRNEIKNMKNLPQRITITRDGQKIIFRDKAEFQKYQQEHGKGFNTQSWGVDMKILLEIKVPRNTETRIESVYGFVEVKDFAGPLTAISTYAGIDATLTEKLTGEVTAETNYGEIYTNLDTKFGGESSRQGDFHTYVSAKPGNGPRYSFESKYGSVYMRKSN